MAAKELDTKFAEFLMKKQDSIFELDLRNAPLVTVVDKMVEIKGKLRRNYDKQYSALKKHLIHLQAKFNCIFRTEQVCDIFWVYFIKYLDDMELSAAYIKKLCGQLKLAVEWGGKHNAKVSPTYADYDINSEEKVKVVLSASDIARIYYFDLNTIKCRSDHRKTLERVKDFIVLSCNLGQRWSDMTRVTPDCFDRNIFRITQQKTGHKAVVDIDRFAVDKKMAYEILEKYNYHAPIEGDISNYNHRLRELMMYVGLDEPVKKEYKRDGEIVIDVVPKYMLISSHTARRSFCTYNFLANTPKREIMRASGHKTEESFNRYIIYDD